MLVAIIKRLVGAVVWDAAWQAVLDLMDSRIPGDQKRARVLDDLQQAFQEVPTALLNLVIELAVVKAKS